MGKNIKTDCKKLDSFEDSQKCAFCCTSEVNDNKLGPIYMYKNVITHYFCLLLSSNMEQNGRDHEGILGFLNNDIQKEIKRGQRLFCTYCKHKGATLGCSIRKCRTVFHLPCGLRNDSLHQFFGQFRSYCSVHRPRQDVDQDILAEARKHTAVCPICCEDIVPYPGKSTLWAPCCKKNAWFHRDCVQRMAISFGYFFKCPLCNNKDIFQETMKYCGIYIPEQDASWEVVPNAFGELYERHDTCDAEHCTSPKGRRGNYVGTRWELVLCGTCGSQGIHIGCGRLKWTKPEWICPGCSGVLQPKSAAVRREKYQTRLSEQKKGSGSTSRTRSSSVSCTSVKDDSSSSYNSCSSDDEKNTRPYYRQDQIFRKRKRLCKRSRSRQRLYKRSPSPPMLRRHPSYSHSASLASHSPPVLKDVHPSSPTLDSPFRKSEVSRRDLYPHSSPSVRSESHKAFSPLFKKSSVACTNTIPTIIVDDDSDGGEDVDDDDDDDVVMVIDDSPDDVVITNDGSQIKVMPMREDTSDLKFMKAEGDPRVEKIIEYNIELAHNSSKAKSVSAGMHTTPYTSGLVHSTSVEENIQRRCNVQGLEAYRVPVQEYSMSSTSFAPQTNTYIISSDLPGQNGYLEQETHQQPLIPMWNSMQQNSYVNAEIASQQQRKLVSSSKRSPVSINSDICEHGTANSNSVCSRKRQRTTKPAGAASATCNKENGHSQPSCNKPGERMPGSNRNRLNPYVLVTRLNYTVVDGKIKVLNEPKTADRVNTQRSVRKQLKFNSLMNSKNNVKLSCKNSSLVQADKTKENVLKSENNTIDISSYFTKPSYDSRKNANRTSNGKSESKLKKRQELKTKKLKTNKIMFNFFNKPKIVDYKLKYQLQGNTINGYFEPRPYDKNEIGSELIRNIKCEQIIGDTNNRNNTFSFNKDAKIDNTNFRVHADSNTKIATKLDNISMSKPVLFESTNCNHDEFSNLKSGKSRRQAIKLNRSSENKIVKVKKCMQKKEFEPGKETSKENVSNLKIIHKVRTKGKLGNRYINNKPSFKIKFINKGNLMKKHKKLISKVQSNDFEDMFLESKGDSYPLHESGDVKHESPEKTKLLSEHKELLESKVNKCLCSYFERSCSSCSGRKLVYNDDPGAVKKQTKEKILTENSDSSQLKLRVSGNRFCLTRDEPQ